MDEPRHETPKGEPSEWRSRWASFHTSNKNCSVDDPGTVSLGAGMRNFFGADHQASRRCRKVVPDRPLAC